MHGTYLIEVAHKRGIKDPLALKLTNTRTFGNGNVFLSYEPMA